MPQRNTDSNGNGYNSAAHADGYSYGNSNSYDSAAHADGYNYSYDSASDSNADSNGEWDGSAKDNADAATSSDACASSASLTLAKRSNPGTREQNSRVPCFWWDARDCDGSARVSRDGFRRDAETNFPDALCLILGSNMQEKSAMARTPAPTREAYASQRAATLFVQPVSSVVS